MLPKGYSLQFSTKSTRRDSNPRPNKLVKLDSYQYPKYENNFE